MELLHAAIKLRQFPHSNFHIVPVDIHFDWRIIHLKQMKIWTHFGNLKWLGTANYLYTKKWYVTKWTLTCLYAVLFMFIYEVDTFRVFQHMGWQNLASKWQISNRTKFVASKYLEGGERDVFGFYWMIFYSSALLAGVAKSKFQSVLDARMPLNVGKYFCASQCFKVCVGKRARLVRAHIRTLYSI